MQRPTKYPTIEVASADDIGADPDFSSVFKELEPMVKAAGEMTVDEFDVLDYPELAKCIYIIDVEHDPERYYYRFFGSELAERYGRDISGTYCDQHKDLMGEKYDEYFTIHQLVTSNIGTVKHTGSFAWVGKSHNRFSSLHFPLVGKDGRVSRQVVLMIFRG